MNTITRHFGVFQLGKDLSIAIILSKLDKTPNVLTYYSFEQVLSSPVTSPTCGLASLLNENAQAMLSNTTIPSSDPEFSL